MALTARNTAVRATAALAIGALALLGLASCKATPTAPETSSSASPQATPSSSASPTPDATSSATPKPTPASAPGTSMGVDCNGLLSPQTVYNFNQNTSLQPAYKPKSGTDGAVALSFNGISCGLVNNSSGAITSVSVAHPAASDLATLKSTAAKGTAVSGLGDSAYFSTSGQTGQLQVFKGPFWMTASSVFFGSADDARQLVGAALAAVK
ncbi:MAG: hypothetical protein ABI400_10300 [Lacisediminihabitans sp.]